MKNFQVQSDSVFSKKSNEETVVLDAKRDLFFSLEGAGQELWDLVQSGGNYESLVTHLVENYELPMDRAQEDVDQFLEQLETQGLIRVEI